MQDAPLRVTRLEEIDWKAVRELIVEPGEWRLVLIRGGNGSGKSSALDAIVSVLGGAKLDPPEPIRLGQDRAEVTLTLGNQEVKDRYIAKVVWQRSTAGEVKRELILAERTAKGLSTPRKPQTTLSELVGELATDPLALVRTRKRQEQAMALLTAAGKAKEYTEHAGQIEKAAQEARLAHAAAREQRLLADALPPPPLGSPREKPDTTQALKDWTVAKQRAEAWEALQRDRDQAARRLQVAEEEVQRLKAALQTAEARRADAAMSKNQADALANSPRPDTSSAEAAYTQISARIAGWEAGQQKSRAAAAASASEKEWDEARGRLEKCRSALTAEVQSCVAATGLDITIDEDMGLRVGGVPLEQLSTSEKVKLSAVVAMQQPRAVRIARIDEGDALDEESLTTLVRIAEKYDYQLLMTAVYAQPGVSIADKTLVVPMTKVSSATSKRVVANVATPVSLDDL